MSRGGPVPEQLQASRDLVNEGLSGLVPRAKVLLTVGAAVPTAFAGLAAVAVCVFAVLALGLEGKFIHGAGVLLLVLLFLFFGVFEREERGERGERREKREERGKRGEREEREVKAHPLSISLFLKTFPSNSKKKKQEASRSRRRPRSSILTPFSTRTRGRGRTWASGNNEKERKRGREKVVKTKEGKQVS
jgi:hypothetical protein